MAPDFVMVPSRGLHSEARSKTRRVLHQGRANRSDPDDADAGAAQVGIGLRDPRSGWSWGWV